MDFTATVSNVVLATERDFVNKAQSNTADLLKADELSKCSLYGAEA